MFWMAGKSGGVGCVAVLIQDAGCSFAQMIGTREHAEYMWRITKDDDQHSHLEKEQLAD